MAENSAAVKKEWRQLFPNWGNNNIENRPYLCKVCDERFQLPKAIREHYKAKHPGTTFVVPEMSAGPGNVLPPVQDRPSQVETVRKQNRQRKLASKKKRKRLSDDQKLEHLTAYDSALDKDAYCKVHDIRNQRISDWRAQLKKKGLYE